MMWANSDPHSWEKGRLWLKQASGGDTLLHPLPPFCDAEKVKNHALGSLVHLAEVNCSNYQAVVTILPEKSATNSLSSGYSVMWVRFLNS